MRLKSEQSAGFFYPATIPLLMGILALTGWALDIHLLKSGTGVNVYMNPLSATLFAITSCYIISKYKQAQSSLILDIIFAMLLVAAASFRLSDSIFDTEFYIDRILFKSTIGDNRMSPVAAGIFVLVAFSISFSGLNSKAIKKISEFFVLISLFGCLIYLSSYLFNIYKQSEEWISHLSLNTSIAFFCLNLSLLSFQKNGLAEFIKADNPGSRLFRRILPFLLIIPFSVGFLRTVGENYGVLDSQFGASLAAGTIAFLSTFLLYHNSVLLNRIEFHKNKLNEELIQKSRDLEQSQFLLEEAGKISKIGGWELDVSTMTLNWTDEVFKIYELEKFELPCINDIFNFYPPEVRVVVRRAFESCLLEGLAYDIELPLITSKGNKIWVRNCGKALKEAGKVVKLVGVFQDITDRKIAEEHLSVIFEQSTHAHVLYNETGVINCNNAAVSLMGLGDKQELLNLSLSKFSPEYQPDGGISADKAREMDVIALEKGYHQFEWVHLRKDGEAFTVEVTLTPVTVDNKRAILGVWHDITAQKSAKEKLMKNEAILKETQRLTQSGSWEIDLQTDTIYWSEEMYRIFGFNPEFMVPDRTIIEDLVHPDDKTWFFESNRKLIEENEPSDIDLRIVLPDGELKYIHSIGKTILNDAGKVVKLYGAIIDITERKKTEEVLRIRKEQLRSFVKYSPAAIAMFDKEMKYVAASDTWYCDYKLSRKEITGKSHYEVFPEVPDRWKDDHRRCLAGEILKSEEDSFTRLDGSTEWLRWELRPWLESSSEIGGLIMFTEVITEKKKAIQTLIKAKEEAEQAVKAKAEFLSTMSHEIRTPMNAVIGFTQLLLHDARPDQVEYLNLLKFSGDNLLALINDILDYSKIEAGKIEFEVVNFNLKELLQNIQGALAESAGNKGIKLDLKIAEGAPKMVTGDPMRLTQILNNLISNAVKFTSQGSVTISAEPVKRTDRLSVVRFKVIDTGIGIPRDKQAYIFESFTQASSETTRKYGGTGLGLTITKRLLEMQGSRIELDSEHGKGSTFYFDLLFKNELEPLTEDRGTCLPELKSLAGLKLLLAEDNKINIVLAKQFLKRWDIACDVAENGKQALEMVKAYSYDLVLMDLQMPEMDGYQATREIRKLEDERFKTLPIIALTASAMIDKKDSAYEAGMNDYVSKPFRPEELYRKICLATNRQGIAVTV